MKFRFVFLLLFPPFFAISQLPSSNELYQKIENYYRKNSVRVEYIERSYKSPLSYDTSRSAFAYVVPGNKTFMIAFLDTFFSVKHGFYFSENYYNIEVGVPEKIRVKQRELPGSAYSHLEKIPLHNIDHLESAFGKITSLQKVKGLYVATTPKFILTIDTLSYRVINLLELILSEGKMQSDRYNFRLLPDSILEYLKDEVSDLIIASQDLPTNTYKQMRKDDIPLTVNEGKTFAFEKLISFNKGPLDSSLKNKYVILDFFYQSCLPCHKMTGYILDWLPSIDTSKIILVGVDPTDAEPSMKLFIKDKKISYPIIIGQQAKDIVHYYQIHAYPTLFLLSPDSKIQTVHEGMSKTFLTKAEKIISK